MHIVLEVASGRNAGLKIPMKSRRFLIGRADDCDLRAHSEQVSRYHCGILREESGVFVRDYGSRNGTFVDGERVVDRKEVTAGGRLRVGPLEFIVHLHQSIDAGAIETVNARNSTGTVPSQPNDEVAASTSQEPSADDVEVTVLPAPSRTPSSAATKPPSGAETNRAAAEGLKRMFSPRKPKGG